MTELLVFKRISGCSGIPRRANDELFILRIRPIRIVHSLRTKQIYLLNVFFCTGCIDVELAAIGRQLVVLAVGRRRGIVACTKHWTQSGLRFALLLERGLIMWHRHVLLHESTSPVGDGWGGLVQRVKRYSWRSGQRIGARTMLGHNSFAGVLFRLTQNNVDLGSKEAGQLYESTVKHKDTEMLNPLIRTLYRFCFHS